MPLTSEDKVFVSEAIAEALSLSRKADAQESPLEELRAHNEREMQGRSFLASSIFQMRESQVAAGNAYAQAGLRGLAIVNGGGILIVVTLAGNIVTKESCSVSVIASSLAFPMFLYVFGLVTTLISSFLAYLSFGFVSVAWADPVSLSNWVRDPKGAPIPVFTPSVWIDRTTNLSIGFAVLATAAFLAASMWAIHAMMTIHC
jgi:hypothetical protein